MPAARHEARSWRSHLLPALTLGAIVLASATQTEFAHTLSSDWSYSQPYFTFYVTHSTFSLVFPVHLAILAITRSYPWRSYLSDIRLVLADQLDLSPLVGWGDITRVYGRKVVWLTLLISVPALAWFVAMLYSTALDVSAIYATSAFWAYFFSMWLLGQPLSRTTMGSIALAFAGVIVLSLDGLQGEDAGEEDGSGEGRGRAFGDIIMLVGAIILGLYEVVYKLVLPEGHGGVSSSDQSTLVADSYDPVPAEEFEYDDPSGSGSDTPVNDGPKRKRSDIALTLSPRSRLSPGGAYGGTADVDGADDNASDLENIPTPADIDTPHPHPQPRLPTYHVSGPPSLPPALHANFLTSCIGLATLTLLLPAIPILHWLGWETFHWPQADGVSTSVVWGAIFMVAINGAIYNAGLMILIGLWGPTTSSVANLLTIGLVALLDAIVMGVMPSLVALLGVGMICAGFGILLWEGEGH